MDSSPTLPDALIVAIPLACGVAFVGYRRAWLDRGGAIAALCVGGAIFTGGWNLVAALLFFFFSAGILGHIARRQLSGMEIEAEQHRARGAGQVLAVGLVPALGALGFALAGKTAFYEAALAALAFATADTWATDIGMTAARPPRLLGIGRRVPRGVSGGMSWRGTVASVAGAAAVSTMGLFGSTADRSSTLLKVTVLGVAAGLLDSLLGATLQRRDRCPVCGIVTERKEHCGAATVPAGGLLSNTGVNFVCSVAVALAAIVMWG